MSTAIAQDRALHGTSSSSLGLSISVAQIRCVALVVVLAAAGVTRAAGEGTNLVPPIIDAVEARATLGEIADGLRSVFGEYEETATV